MTVRLKAVPLTRERFAPYGDVIDTARSSADPMNAQRFERFDDLCRIELDKDGHTAVSVARCRTPTTLPLRLDIVERHPLGSQAFIPLSPAKMVVVVAPPGESVSSSDLRAFVTNGRQGFNYRRGTWHMPLISFSAGQEYLIIDRGGKEPNCEEFALDDVELLDVD